MDKMDIKMDKMDIKMDMIGGFVMPGFWGFIGVMEGIEKFKADKMDKMDIKYIYFFIYDGFWRCKAAQGRPKTAIPIDYLPTQFWL
jgi:hypothetical protein